MPDKLYTAKAHVTGGRMEGHGRSSDGALDVQLRIPPEMGGPGGGTNPEQLFAVGYAACFEGALGVVARRAKVEAGDAAIDSEVSLSPDGHGGFLLSVGLDVTLPWIAERPAQSTSCAPRTRSARIRTRPAATSRSRSRPTARRSSSARLLASECALEPRARAPRPSSEERIMLEIERSSTSPTSTGSIESCSVASIRSASLIAETALSRKPFAPLDGAPATAGVKSGLPRHGVRRSRRARAAHARMPSAPGGTTPPPPCRRCLRRAARMPQSATQAPSRALRPPRQRCRAAAAWHRRSCRARAQVVRVDRYARLFS